MKATAAFRAITLFLLIQAACAPRVKMPGPPESAIEPLVRIAILQGIDQVVFNCDSGFEVVDQQGERVLSSRSQELKWTMRIKTSQPADTVYRLVLSEEKSKDQALIRIAEYERTGFHADIVQTGRTLYSGSQMINDNRRYLVTIGPYATQGEARARQVTLPNGADSWVIPDIAHPPLGLLNLVSPAGEMALSSGESFLLRPRDLQKARFTIYEVPVGRGFWWEHQEDRIYRGQLEFRLGNDGRLLVINTLHLEDYLKGVLPGEMSPGFPAEALRAQAIAARSYTIARMGIQHSLDPFDLCADVHCQAYTGVNKEHSATNQAVDGTRGHVLLYDGMVCDAVYSAVCGGHTENKVNVWGGQPQAYLKGVVDASTEEEVGFSLDLDMDERDVRAWVMSAPAVYCNHLSEEAPAFLQYTKKHFRWEVAYGRQELEEIITEKTGRTFGNLVDIIPIRRGISGRLVTIEIVGDTDKFLVERELNIRRALSLTYLPSACFVIDREIGPNGVPDAFVFHGAGWGHGVGMCQVGAAGMALQGMDHGKILSHYYTGAEVRQIYDFLF